MEFCEPEINNQNPDKCCKGEETVGKQEDVTFSLRWYYFGPVIDSFSWRLRAWMALDMRRFFGDKLIIDIFFQFVNILNRLNIKRWIELLNGNFF